MNRRKPTLSLYKVRQLVKIVLDEMEEPSGPFAQDEPAEILWCLIKFQGLSEDYNERLARKVLSLATNRSKPYLEIEPESLRTSRQKLILTSDGLILLTKLGFVNELIQNTFVNILPALSIIISFIALLVSIFK